MDDLKDKAKDLMSSMRNPFKQKFKGQGHRLGEAEASASSTPSTSFRSDSGLTGSAGPPRTLGSAATQPTPRQAAAGIGGGNPGPAAGTRHQAGQVHKQNREGQKLQQSDLQRAQHERWQQINPGPPAPSSAGGFAPRPAHRSGPSPPSPSPVAAAPARALSAGDRAFLTRQGPAPAPAQPPHSRDLQGRSTHAQASASQQAQGSAASSARHGVAPPGSARNLATQSGPPDPAQVQCPVCQQWWRSESEVALHVDRCLADRLAESSTSPVAGASHQQAAASAPGPDAAPAAIAGTASEGPGVSVAALGSSRPTEAGAEAANPPGADSAPGTSGMGAAPGTSPTREGGEGVTAASSLGVGGSAKDGPDASARDSAAQSGGDASSGQAAGFAPLRGPALGGEGGGGGEDDEVHHAVAVLLSNDPSPATLALVAKLLQNITGDPSAEKFRRVRLSNPRIAETIGSAVGGVDFLLAVGFQLVPEGGSEGQGQGAEEVWAVMRDTSPRQVARVNAALDLLKALAPQDVAGASAFAPGVASERLLAAGEAAAATGAAPAPSKPRAIPRLADRQVQVFLPPKDGSSTAAAARIEVPDAFYNKTAAEVRAEALARKKRLEDSQVLMTRAQRERLAAGGAARRLYNTCIMRVQFPDGLLLQGLFLPQEPTSALAFPFPTKNPFIPSVASPSSPMPTLEDADLVPASLIKFRPLDLSPYTYTGLHRHYVALAQPLTSTVLQNHRK
eukprot:jgi/Mesen1/8764/ME000524S08057